MAIVIANLGTANASSTDSQTYQRTFTPLDNSVTFVHCVGRAAGSPGSPTFSDDHGLTWTSQQNATFSVSRQRIFRTITVGASPGSITVTVDWGATILSCAMGMISVTGVNLTTPVVVGSTTTATGSGTTPASGTVTGLAAAGNARILFCGHERGTADQSPEASWTEIYDVAAATAAVGGCAYYLIGEDTSPTCTLGGSAQWIATALELSIASAVSGGGAWYYSTQQG